jgi:peptidoglycan-N-acetylglucosamine deacetylase
MRSIIPVFKPSSILSLFFRGLTWTIPNKNNEVYLTFDDGPVPDVTPWVLDVLCEYDIKATFFCVGENVKNNPEIYQRILAEGHAVGNHTMHHRSGWKESNDLYVQEIEEASKYINSNLFRPPYGEISPVQYGMIKDKYKVIMWDVLSKDYDQSLEPEDCLENVKSQVKSGSLIVMHDSVKAEYRLKKSLEGVIDYLLASGYRFGKVEYKEIK